MNERREAHGNVRFLCNETQYEIESICDKGSFSKKITFARISESLMLPSSR